MLLYDGFLNKSPYILIFQDKTIESLATVQPPDGVSVDLEKWLSGDLKHSYAEWLQRMPRRKDPHRNKDLKKDEARMLYLSEKYGQRWYYRCKKLRGIPPLKLANGSWLKEVIFNPSSRLARQVVCNMVENLCQGTGRKKEVLLLLTTYLDELCVAGESSAEYLSLYQSLIKQAPWKQFLAVRGVLNILANLLTKEIEELHRLEETTLTSDLAQGYSLKMLTELLSTFLEQENIKQQYKGRLVGAVLNGYLSLRRLVVQRTRLIDETQEKLLELLEEMTTGKFCYSPVELLLKLFILSEFCFLNKQVLNKKLKPLWQSALKQCKNTVPKT